MLEIPTQWSHLVFKFNKPTTNLFVLQQLSCQGKHFANFFYINCRNHDCDQVLKQHNQINIYEHHTVVPNKELLASQFSSSWSNAQEIQKKTICPHHQSHDKFFDKNECFVCETCCFDREINAYLTVVFLLFVAQIKTQSTVYRTQHRFLSIHIALSSYRSLKLCNTLPPWISPTFDEIPRRGLVWEAWSRSWQPFLTLEGRLDSMICDVMADKDMSEVNVID